MGDTCWLNGRLCATEEARIDPADRGFTLGDGLFETVAVQAGGTMLLDRHLDRLAAGCALLRLHNPWTRTAMAAAAGALIGCSGREGALRITLSRGPAERGVLPSNAAPTLLMQWSAAVPRPGRVRAIVSRTTRRNEFSPLARVKSINYLDGILARIEASEAGAQEAILLNTRGTIAEASAANVFILRAGVLLTPPVADGALPGIMRGLLLERAGAVQATLTLADLRAAEAVLLTSALGITQLTTLEDVAYAPTSSLEAEFHR